MLWRVSFGTEVTGLFFYILPVRCLGSWEVFLTQIYLFPEVCVRSMFFHLGEACFLFLPPFIFLYILISYWKKLRFSHSMPSRGAPVSQHFASCHYLSVCVLTCVFPASGSSRCTGLTSSQLQWNQCQMFPSLIGAAEPVVIHVSEDLPLPLWPQCARSATSSLRNLTLGADFFSLDGINEQEQQQLQPLDQVQKQGDSTEGL